MDIVLERILSLIPKKENGDFKHGALKEFANSVGLKSGNLISDWTSGRSNSYKNYVYVIAEKYNVPIAWLTGESDIKEKATAVSGDDLSVVKKAMIDWVVNAPDSEIEALYQFLQRNAK